eukprot:548475-Amphidinium_carterae.1
MDIQVVDIIASVTLTQVVRLRAHTALARAEVLDPHAFRSDPENCGKSNPRTIQRPGEKDSCLKQRLTDGRKVVAVISAEL